MNRIPRDRLEAVIDFGVDAVSFQALKSGTSWWHDVSPPAGTGALLAYVESGRSWIAIGTPLVTAEARADAARRFVEAARAARRRAVFFGVEQLAPFDSCRRLLLGQQSVLHVAEWPATLRRRPRLREQLRRARAKGVTVRIVGADVLIADPSLRAAVDRLRREWLESRAMEPMAFLVAVEPFHAPAEHIYVVAERRGHVVQFLSAVPIDGGAGWLMEDMLRGVEAPNGTTELIIDGLMRRLDGDPHWVTPGLTPLSGPIAGWVAGLRFVSVPLYDFSGLRKFRERLQPAAWRPIWLVWDRGPAALVLLDVLRAFAGGAMLRFASRSLVRHANGPPWAVALPLVPWTVLLLTLAASGHPEMLGFSTTALALWILFDATMTGLLFRVARHPRRRDLLALAGAALFDAIVSVRHFVIVGAGPTLATAGLRFLATAGPVMGTVALAWASWRATR